MEHRWPCFRAAWSWSWWSASRCWSGSPTTTSPSGPRWRSSPTRARRAPSSCGASVASAVSTTHHLPLPTHHYLPITTYLPPPTNHHPPTTTHLPLPTYHYLPPPTTCLLPVVHLWITMDRLVHYGCPSCSIS